MIQYIYIRNILCICWGHKLEERELAAMHHERRRGYRWGGRRKRKGHGPPIVRKSDFWTRGRRYHWVIWRRGYIHMEIDGDLCYCCLSPPQIKLQGNLCRQPTVPRDTMSSLELDLRIRKSRTQTLRMVNNRAKLRSHRMNMAEFDHESEE
jgi:hypothetical protein